MAESLPSLAKLISSLPFQRHDYDFLSVIGSGGSSVVFKVKSSKYDSTFFAAKVTSKSSSSSSFDIDVLKCFVHPYIISVYDYFEDDYNSYTILEYCSNGSLSSIIKSGKIKTKEEMLFFMHKITEAIYFCHFKGIAHRDIKPSNILVDSYGRPKLIDFGICEMLYFNPNSVNNDDSNSGYYSALRKGKQQLIRKFFGSNPYLAPEIVLKEAYDPFAADVWALGVTFFEIVTGSLPWNTQSEKTMEDSICQASISFPSSTPNDIQKLITLMLQVDPSQRPTMKSIANCSLFQEEISSVFPFSRQRHSFSGAKTSTKQSNIMIGQKNRTMRSSEYLLSEDSSNDNSIDNCHEAPLSLSHAFKSTTSFQKKRRCATLPTPETPSFKTSPSMKK